ncbi:hypothetical protein OIU76_017027 [Salix suchowensis]|uniref:Uncharacterized protein n=1 Tax=Salix suchowensis TaxID=1278906 RepID=A0ABQ9C2B5_9ROSI|nr:hypothetical protein OIU76_017027 [Salix suchowensis]KAJ6340789.1 hypothetical protein OIU78_009049 [Salix suchowensis]KAJ6392604.1 hypothetical protein OIU77_022163 [Salix suchowensis]
MLDWWERYLFNILVIVLMWFVFYNGSRYVTEFCKSLEKDYYAPQLVKERGTGIRSLNLPDLYQLRFMLPLELEVPDFASGHTI